MQIPMTKMFFSFTCTFIFLLYVHKGVMIKGEMHFNDRNVNENYNNSITKLTSRSTYIVYKLKLLLLVHVVDVLARHTVYWKRVL